MNLIPYSRQRIDEDDIKAVEAVLKSDFITQGPKPREFEEKLAEYCGAKYCVVFNSGTSALHAAYSASGLQVNDEFITTPVSFVATSNAGLYLGARPVFVDVKQESGNIDESKVEEEITENTRLLVPVHYAGHPIDMETIHSIAKMHGIPLIEDACHALGAEYKGQKIGSCQLSDMAVFSFHPVKHIATGEGGAVVTNDKEYYEKLLMFGNHGITNKTFTNESDGDWYYEMHFLGHNFRMTDIHASLGISQLKKLDGFVERRRQVAGIYNKAFKDNQYFDILHERDYAFSSYHLYPIRLKKDYAGRKKEIYSILRTKKLGVQVHYIPIYLQPYYQYLGYKKGSCPEAEQFYRSELSIPIYPAIKDKEIQYVIETILSVLDAI